jgi:hypothetical protein
LPDETFKGPGGGEYTLLGAEPPVFTVTTHDGRVIRMFVADVLAFADFIRGRRNLEPCL